MKNGFYLILDKNNNILNCVEINDGDVYYHGCCESDSIKEFKKDNKNNTIQLINKPVTTTNEQPILTDLELNWLKYELEARNQEYGYEPNDLKIKNSIIKKVG
jgi:hypothetical protein